MCENRHARYATLNATQRCRRNFAAHALRRNLSATSLQKTPTNATNARRRRPASRRSECKRCGQTKPRSDFCHGPNKWQALDHCAACKDHKECKECRRFKPPTEYDMYASRCLHERCRACEHPVCAACGYQHPRTKQAVSARRKVNGQWFCEQSKACRDAARLARKVLEK